MSSATIIIAEAGVNHNGDMQIARQLIDVAESAGADYVKFQTYSAQRLVTRDAGKAPYQLLHTDVEESQYEMLQKLELSRAMHEQLWEYSKSRNIGIISTGFDIGDIDMLVELGVDFIKIPSGEITNLPYLRYVGALGLDVVLSTGMSTLDEIMAALDILEANGTARSRITVLHCSSAYPTPFSEVNLLAMNSIGSACGVRFGYSDHTSGIEVAIAAVALGASVIEKHFTLDRNMLGPDHKASLEPVELAGMITAIRHVELSLGSDVKMPGPVESRNLPLVRKSIVAKRSIKAGEAFNEHNLATKRPGLGISPMQWDEVIGRVANRDFEHGELIEL